VIGPYGCRKTSTNASVRDRTSWTVDGPDRSPPCPLDMQMKQENNRSNIIIIIIIIIISIIFIFLFLFIMTEKKGEGIFLVENSRDFAKNICEKRIFCCKLILCFFLKNSSENEKNISKLLKIVTFAYYSFKIFCFRILNIAKFG
jgi:hypothetical protein